MRKTIVFVLVLCIAMTFAFSQVSAGPAPLLTSIKITAFTADNYDKAWQDTPASYPKSMGDYSFSGSELYMKVIYTGYPNWSLTFIKVGGNQYKHNTLLHYQRPITTRGGIIIGYEIVYRIPALKLDPKTTISVSSVGVNGGSGDDVATKIAFK